MSGAQLSVGFFLQMAVILLTCRLVGQLARRVGQPQVVGEMIAGVLLGPSLFGWVAPAVQAWVFPRESLAVLQVGAQFGVGLYMFLVGLEFDTATFRTRARGASAVAVAGMVVPFLLAWALTPWLAEVPGLFAARAESFEITLFVGAAIAITAFPMLARILFERGLTGTSLGTLALAAGAIGDAGAWCVLAVVLATFGGDALVAWQAVGGGLAYAVVVLTLGRRLLAKLGQLVEAQGELSPALLGVTLALFCAGAWLMDAAGMHAVFGGFLLGVAMPREGRYGSALRAQLEPFVVVFLLPMFFTYSGLNTRLDLVDDPALVGVTLALLVASCVGKGGACWAAARLCGEDNRTALAVGALMNARGLMELIILNIGLSRGVIGPPFFSMMVLMAVMTTLMATPLFEWCYGRHHRGSGHFGTMGHAGAGDVAGTPLGREA